MFDEIQLKWYFLKLLAKLITNHFLHNCIFKADRTPTLAKRVENALCAMHLLQISPTYSAHWLSCCLFINISSCLLVHLILLESQTLLYHDLVCHCWNAANSLNIPLTIVTFVHLLSFIYPLSFLGYRHGQTLDTLFLLFWVYSLVPFKQTVPIACTDGLWAEVSSPIQFGLCGTLYMPYLSGSSPGK